jgi:hypothetical protein
MKDRNQGISAGFSVSLSSSLLTDFRFGFFRYHLQMDSLDVGTTPASDAGIAGLNLGDFYTSGMPDIELDNPKLTGLPIAGNLDFLRFGYSPSANTCNCPLREREQQFQFVDNWTKLLGKHNIRWGADFRYLQNFRLSSNGRPAGHLEFQNSQKSGTGFSLGDFLIGAVASFDRPYNNPANSAALHGGERQKRIFLYAEDTWRINSRLTVNYGLRWEIYLPQSVTGVGEGGWLQLGSDPMPFHDQFVVAGEGGTNLQGGVHTTLRNFGPRVGVAYLLNPKTVIRAGYGRMFDPGYAGTIFGIAATQSPPVSVVDTAAGFSLNSQYQVPLLTWLCTNGCKVPGFVFPQNVPFTVQDVFCLNDGAQAYCPKGTKDVPDKQQADFYALPRRLRLPTVDAWNVALQEALSRHTYLEISYVANKGTHVLNDNTGSGDGPEVPYYDLNQATLVGYVARVVNKDGKQATNCKDAKDIIALNYSYCKTQQNERTPFKPLTTQVRYFGSDASSNYQSAQVKVRHRFSSGFSLLANYTWSKVIDFDNEYYAIDPSISRGTGNFDRTHMFVMTNVWDLPVGRGKSYLGDAGKVLNRVVGGWSLAAITSWSSGLPFTLTYSGCNADIDANAFRPCRPNVVGDVHVTGSRNGYFTTTGGQNLRDKCVLNGQVDYCPTDGSVAAGLQGYNPTDQVVDGVQPGQTILGETIGPWQRPAPGQIGDAGRNSLRGPGFFQSDLAVAKNIPITERVAVQFRADAFNVVNKVNLANPNTVVDGPSGGQITNLANGAIQRQMQFSLRVEF